MSLTCISGHIGGLLRIAFGRVKRIFLASGGNAPKNVTLAFVRRLKHICARLYKTILRYFDEKLYLHDFVPQRRYAKVKKETGLNLWSWLFEGWITLSTG